MPAALVVDYLLRPEGPHHVYLLLNALATVVEILAEGLELNGVPPHGDAQDKTTTTQNVYRCGLLGDQGSLTLRQDDYAGDELDALGDGRSPTQEHENLVEVTVYVVKEVDSAVLVEVSVGPDYVVVDDEAFEAHLLAGLD